MMAEETQRRSPRRPAHGRCPRCKKIRRLWVNPDHWYGPRQVSSMNVPGEGKVCWICRIREVQPDWHPGMPIPELPRRTKFKQSSGEEL
jgi:hypothetical protein